MRFHFGKDQSGNWNKETRHCPRNRAVKRLLQKKKKKEKLPGKNCKGPTLRDHLEGQKPWDKRKRHRESKIIKL